METPLHFDGDAATADGRATYDHLAPPTGQTVTRAAAAGRTHSLSAGVSGQGNQGHPF